MVAVSDTAGTSAPVLGVRPSGDHTQKMSAMHDQLKSLHFRSWLSLLDDAGDESTLFRDTSLSQLSSEHRLKAIAHYAPSTMAAYLRMWSQWQAFASCHGMSPYAPL